jgi:hypothetical protein
MKKSTKNIFYWYPYSPRHRIKYRRPSFKECKNNENPDMINMIVRLHEILINMKDTIIDTDSLYIYNHDFKSLLIDCPDCGPLIEFYFHRYAPLFHACITNIKAKTIKEYNKKKRHYLLTITKDLLHYYEDDISNISWLEIIHGDGRRRYDLKINNKPRVCLRSENKFLSMSDFLTDLNKCYDIEKFKLVVEKFEYLHT